VKRLEQVFQMLGQKPKAVTCPAIDGIIDEADDITGEVDDKDVLDAAIIAAGQAVEHYEMTRYGSLIAWAKRLGRADVARILDQTLTEEKAADKKLTTIAETKVNLRAAS
jgi:ferritin-like metal-binding protein YciE